MKKLQFVVYLGLSLGTFQTHSQDLGIDGKWVIKWTTSAGNPGEAELEMAGATGSFKQFARVTRGRLDPCLSVKAPVTAEASGEETIFLVRTSEALTGCSDRRLKVKRVDERTFEGSFGANGAALTMIRQ